MSKDLNISFTKLGNEECTHCEAHKLYVGIHKENNVQRTIKDQNNESNTDKEYLVLNPLPAKESSNNLDDLASVDHDVCDKCADWNTHLLRTK